MRYAALKGLTLYPERDEKYAALNFVIYWLVPEEDRMRDIEQAEWAAMTQEARSAHIKAENAQILRDRELPRTDPALVQVVEEMGRAANGQCADLRIAEVPAGSKYRIDEYDGLEAVMTPDDYSWEIA